MSMPEMVKRGTEGSAHQLKLINHREPVERTPGRWWGLDKAIGATSSDGVLVQPSGKASRRLCAPYLGSVRHYLF